MKALFSSLVFAIIIVLSHAQSAGTPNAPATRSKVQPVRFTVRSADPYYVVAMLEGIPIVSPEMSTIMGFMGFPQQAGQAVNRLFQSGHLLVNPTDNSIWWYPDR